MEKTTNSFLGYGSWLSLLCFVICLFFPAYYAGIDALPGSSLFLLLLGWLGPLDGHYSWFANPVYGIALILGLLRQHPRLTAALSGLSLCIALTFLLNKEILINEAGHQARIVAYGWGYWLGLAAFVVLAAGAIGAIVVEQKTTAIEHPEK